MICTVLNGTTQLAYPKEGYALGEAVPREELFTRRFTYDAFALSHAIPEGEKPVRVTKEDYLARFPALRYCVLFADLDAHDLSGDALETWKNEELDKCRALGHGLFYPTSRGVRLAWSIDLPWHEYVHVAKTWNSELERRNFRGLDRSSCSFARHMRLPFVRRDGRDQAPRIEGVFGPLPWDPGPAPPPKIYLPRPKATHVLTPGNAPEVLTRALSLGLATPIADGKYAVTCPTRPHGGSPSKTAILPDGRFKCFSAGCEHLTFTDWAVTIPSEHTSLHIAEEQIEAGIRRGGIAQRLVVLDVPCGVGKSHVARRLLPPGSILEGVTNVLLSPTNALSTQHREACGAEQHAGVAADIEGRMPCVQPKVIAKLHELGLSSKYACQTCPNREGCKASAPIGDKEKGIVSTHSMLHRFDDGNLILIDEMPEITETFDIDLSQIPEALAACKRAWAVEVGPWATALIEGRIDERAKERAQDASETPETLKMPTFGEHFDGTRMARTFAPIQVARAVRAAAHKTSKIVFKEGKAHVTRLTPPLAYLQEFGGTLLAAGASETVLRAIRPDVEIVHVHVEDPVPIRRVLVHMSAASTGYLIGNEPRLKDLVREVESTTEGRVLYMCPKSLEPLLRTLTQHDIAHYGALRGLDAWKDSDVFVTIGDHFDNLGAVDAEAAFLGVDAETLSRERVEIELGQAHGRARDPRRTSPCIHMHFGNVWPNGWSKDNALSIAQDAS